MSFDKTARDGLGFLVGRVVDVEAGQVGAGSTPYATFAAAVSAVPVGGTFTTDASGMLLRYDRIAAAPGYGNPRPALTKDAVGLAEADNTSDADKPVSDAQASAISASTGALAQAVADQFEVRTVDTYRSFGAIGDGSSPDTDKAGISAALTSSYLSRTSVAGAWMPWNNSQNQAKIAPGIYDAGDFTILGGNLALIAEIPYTVFIRIPDGKRFADFTGLADYTYIEGIVFIGGKGAVRYSRTAGNVRGTHTFINCVFDNYTECAIQNSADDSPYLRVQNCMFGGRSGYPTIGIAWAGYMDLQTIEENVFLRNLYHIKLGGGNRGAAANWIVRHNDFITLLGRDTSGAILPDDQQTFTKADLWLVPVMQAGGFGTNSGYAAQIVDNKFGNENHKSGNPRILIAPELQADVAAGKPRGAILPDYTWTTSTPNPNGAAFTHILSDLIIDRNRIASESPQTGSVMECYVPDIRGVSWGPDNKFDGGHFAYGVKWMGARVPTAVNTNWSVNLGSAGSPARGAHFQYGFSNYPVGIIIDPAGNMPFDPMTVPAVPAADDALSVTLRDMSLFANWSVFNATKTAYTDRYGGQQGAEIALSASGGGCNSLLAVAPANRLAWLQMTLQKGTANTLEYVFVEVYNFSTQRILSRRRVFLTDDPIEFVAPFTTPDDGTNNWQVRVYSDNYLAGSRERFRVEYGFANMGKRPAQVGDVGPVTVSGFDTPMLRVGKNGYLWIDSGNRLRFKYSTIGRPANATDGRSVSVAFGSTAQRPASPGIGDDYFDQTLVRPIWYSGSVWRDALGRVAAPAFGTTANRPTSPGIGDEFYDQTLGKPIWYSGSAWRDAMGTAV